MSYNIIPTPNFSRRSKRLKKKYPSLKEELLLLSKDLRKEPTKGEPLGRNCYKIKLGVESKGKGKSGGARVITLVEIIDEEIFLVTIYDKSEKENISDKEIDNLLKEAGLL